MTINGRDPYVPSGPGTGTENTQATYARTYVWMRAIVGVLGIALPIVYVLGELVFLRGTFRVQDSISAYYHTSVRDVFVAGMCVIGFLLITYMIGQPRTSDFWLSLVAGVAVVGLVLVPTERPGLEPDDLRCGPRVDIAGCSPVQNLVGETPAAWLHFGFAAVFIAALARVAFLFAKRVRRDRPGMARIQVGCAVLIVVAIGWIAVGDPVELPIATFTPLYVGEVVAIWAFGVSWLLTIRGLRDGLAMATPRPGSAGVAAVNATRGLRDRRLRGRGGAGREHAYASARCCRWVVRSLPSTARTPTRRTPPA
jgi:hypothetical protein